MDPITGRALQRNWPPMDIVCLACFGSSPNIAMDGGAQPSPKTPEKDDGLGTSPSEMCVLCEVTERPRGTPLFGAWMSVALHTRKHTPLASDAR